MPWDARQFGQVTPANPVSAYMEGRAMQMAYRQDQMQLKMQEAAVEALPQRLQDEQQMRAMEMMERQLRLQQMMQPPAPKIMGNGDSGFYKVDESAGTVEQLTQPTKPPTSRNIVRGDQTVTQEWNRETGQYEDVSSGDRYKPTTTINIDQKDDSAFAKKSGENAAARLDDYRLQADNAVQSLTTLKSSKNFLKKGIISGFAADWRLGFARAANLAGADNDELIANTESYGANMGAEVGRIITLFGSGTGLSDADREYAAKIAAGDIQLNEASMARIIDIRERQSKWTIDRYGKERSRVQDKAGADYYPEITAPSDESDITDLLKKYGG